MLYNPYIGAAAFSAAHAQHNLALHLGCRYYEPLAQVVPCVDDVLSGPPLRKLLFMTQPHVVDSHLKPHWEVGRTCQFQGRTRVWGLLKEGGEGRGV